MGERPSLLSEAAHRRTVTATHAVRSRATTFALQTKAAAPRPPLAPNTGMPQRMDTSSKARATAIHGCRSGRSADRAPARALSSSVARAGVPVVSAAARRWRCGSENTKSVTPLRDSEPPPRGCAVGAAGADGSAGERRVCALRIDLLVVLIGNPFARCLLRQRLDQLELRGGAWLALERGGGVDLDQGGSAPAARSASSTALRSRCGVSAPAVGASTRRRSRRRPSQTSWYWRTPGVCANGPHSR